jgi:mRNA-capping enzyme
MTHLLEGAVQNPYTGHLMPANKVAQLKQYLEKKVLRLTGVRRFPGSHPVSLTKSALGDIRRRRYYVCEKTDGERYLLIVAGKYGCFLLNRRNQYLWVKITVPKRTGPSGPWPPTTQLPPNWQCEDSIFDGELVTEFDGRQVFYVFDTLVAGTNVMELPLTDRLRLVHSELIGARHLFQTPAWGSIFAKEPFQIVAKPMYRAEDVGFVLETVLPSLPHEQDGLIYTPVDRSYRPGTDYALFKWKPPSMNSVDFLFQAPDTLSCSNKGTLERVATLDEATCAPGTIVECVRKEGKWVVLRTREDKSGPNDISVYHKIMESIRDPVLKKHLIFIFW